MKNREIKYRSWDDKNKKMRYNEAILIMPSGHCYIAEEHGGGTKLTPVGVLMEYTGMNDASGKEVYEGDFFAKGGGVVRWVHYRFVVEGKDWENPLSLYYDHKVLGNIYEHKHLL
jgi:hypothetical protein